MVPINQTTDLVQAFFSVSYLILSSEGFLIQIVSLISEASLVPSSMERKDGQLFTTSDLVSSINWAAFHASLAITPSNFPFIRFEIIKDQSNYLSAGMQSTRMVNHLIHLQLKSFQYIVRFCDSKSN